MGNKQNLVLIASVALLGLVAVIISTRTASQYAADSLMGTSSPHMQAKQREMLVVVPKIGQYKDLPPGEYRTAGVGGLYSKGAEKKCMKGLDKDGVEKVLCGDEVVDFLPSKVVPVNKADCSEEGNDDGNCGTLTWQTYLKQRGSTPSLAQRNAQNLINFFEFRGNLGSNPDDQRPFALGAASTRLKDRTDSKKGVPAAHTKQQLYRMKFQDAVKAEDMYAQPSNDGVYEGPAAHGHFGRNLRQPQLSPSAEPRSRSLPAGAQREGYYTRTATGMRAARVRLAPAHARRQSLYLESFPQAMHAQTLYDSPSGDGLMEDDDAYGRFGPNLRQPQISPAVAPTRWSLPPAEARMRTEMADPIA
jgi:hypothetical protein